MKAPKQDRPLPRSTEDLVRKYQFAKGFREAKRISHDIDQIRESMGGGMPNIPTRVSELENDAGYISSIGAYLTCANETGDTVIGPVLSLAANEHGITVVV